MTPESIKNLRKTLNLPQEDFGTILGVTQTTVARYENGRIKPTGDAERKLAQLESVLSDKSQTGTLKDMLTSPDGLAGLAGILALGSALFPLSAITFGGLGLKTILGGTAGATLMNVIAAFQKKNHDTNKNHSDD